MSPQSLRSDNFWYREILPCFFRCILKDFVNWKAFPDFVTPKHVVITDRVMGFFHRGRIDLVQFINIFQDPV